MRRSAIYAAALLAAILVLTTTHAQSSGGRRSMPVPSLQTSAASPGPLLPKPHLSASRALGIFHRMNPFGNYLGPGTYISALDYGRLGDLAGHFYECPPSGPCHFPSLLTPVWAITYSNPTIPTATPPRVPGAPGTPPPCNAVRRIINARTGKLIVNDCISSAG